MIDWETNQQTAEKSAALGPYDLEIAPEGYGYAWYVYIGDCVGDEGLADTEQDAEAAILAYIRADVEKLARQLGVIPSWHPVGETAPPIGESLLVYIAEGGDITDGNYGPLDGWSIGLGNMPGPDPSHWMRAPAPPAKESSK